MKLNNIQILKEIFANSIMKLKKRNNSKEHIPRKKDLI